MDAMFTLTTTKKKKNVRDEVYQYLIKQIANDMDYLNNIITTDKILISCYDPAFKQQTSEWFL